MIGREIWGFREVCRVVGGERRWFGKWEVGSDPTANSCWAVYLKIV